MAEEKDEGSVICPVCGAVNRAGAKFCSECGIKLSFAKELAETGGFSSEAEEEEIEDLLGELLEMEKEVEEEEAREEPLILEEPLTAETEAEAAGIEEDELLQSLLALGEIVEEKIECPVCEQEIPATATECPYCHAKFTVGPEEIVEVETEAGESKIPETAPAPPVAKPVVKEAVASKPKKPAAKKVLARTTAKKPPVAVEKATAEPREQPPALVESAGETAGEEKGFFLVDIFRGHLLDVTVGVTLAAMFALFFGGKMYEPGMANGVKILLLLVVMVVGGSLSAAIYNQRNRIIKIGDRYLEGGRYAEAKKRYEKALAFMKEAEDAWTRKGDVLRKEGRYKEAIEAYNRALQINPLIKEAWLGKGITYHKLGETHKALKCYKNAIQLDPRYASAWNNLGQLYMSVGKNLEALKCFEKATALEPDRPEFWANRGLALANIGKRKEARACLEKGKRLSAQRKKAAAT